MRKVLISAAAAASAMAFAAPAAAQYYPAPPPPGYGYGHNNYGYNHYGYGQVRALQARLDHMQREISRLARYRMITHREYRDLLGDSRELERKLRHDARDGRGLSRKELYNVERRMARLEWKVGRDVRDGRQWRYRW
jgi:hypothetical protein